MTRTKTLLTSAVLLFAASSTGLTDEQNEFKTAGAFVDAYHKNQELLLRIFIRGIGDGLTAYNAAQDAVDGGRKFYCPPEVGIVDAQYVAIMLSFLTKIPTASSQPVGLVLLFALKEAFPCGRQ
jgi:hypothetical protein